MSESPAKPTTNAERAQLVRDRFPTSLCIVEYPYSGTGTVHNNIPQGVSMSIVKARWVDNDGKVRARLEDPAHGDMTLVLTKEGDNTDPKTYSILSKSTIHRIPTEGTIEEIVRDVVNRMWNGVVDNTAEMLARFESQSGALAALQHRVGLLPGLDAHSALEAALRAAEVKMATRVEEAVASVKAANTAADQRVSDLRTEIADLKSQNRNLAERLKALDAMLMAWRGEEATPAAEEPEEPLNAEGKKLLRDLKMAHHATIEKWCMKHELTYPKVGNTAERRAAIAAEIKASDRFRE